MGSYRLGWTWNTVDGYWIAYIVVKYMYMYIMWAETCVCFRNNSALRLPVHRTTETTEDSIIFPLLIMFARKYACSQVVETWIADSCQDSGQSYIYYAVLSVHNVRCVNVMQVRMLFANPSHNANAVTELDFPWSANTNANFVLLILRIDCCATVSDSSRVWPDCIPDTQRTLLTVTATIFIFPPAVLNLWGTLTKLTTCVTFLLLRKRTSACIARSA